MVVTLAWVVVAAFAVIVLAFLGYEVWWKTRRLRSELARLRAVAGRLAALQVELAGAQERVARVFAD